MAKTVITEQARRDALAKMLRRCSQPNCRTREHLRYLPLTGSRRPVAQHLVVLCPRCLERAKRGDFTLWTLQRWKLRGVDYWENVGAE